MKKLRAFASDGRCEVGGGESVIVIGDLRTLPSSIDPATSSKGELRRNSQVSWGTGQLNDCLEDGVQSQPRALTMVADWSRC